MTDLIAQLLEKSGASTPTLPDWLVGQRQEARRLSENMAVPGRKLENWKYTSLKPLSDLVFEAAVNDDEVLCSEDLVDMMIPGLDCHSLVFVNGRFRPQLSLLQQLPDSVRIMALNNASLEPFSASFMKPDEDPSAVFDNINLSNFTDGLLIDIPDAVQVTKPVYCLFFNTSTAQATAQHYRHQIRVGSGSGLTLIEQHCTAGTAATAVTQVSELICHPESDVSHIKIRRQHDSGFLLDSTRVTQHDKSTYRCWSFDLRGRLIRHDCRVELAGAEASCEFRGLYTPNQQEQTDTQLHIDHQQRDCSSSQHYRGVVSDRSRAVFRGKVVVQPGADGADAEQNNANLLLSDQAEVDTRPELEIYADEVQCSHGATVGQLDDNQLFYLRSRGISAQRARSMMMTAFCQQIADSVDNDTIRTYLTGQINEQFDG